MMGKTSDSRYKTARWRRLREAVLRRDGYLCQESKRFGKTKAATTVHHIFPAKDYPYLFFNPLNLISLSHEEHNQMHDRITDEITKKGRGWQDRVRSKLISPPKF